MKTFLLCLLYLPALLGWIVFTYSWRVANWLTNEPRCMRWQWNGIQAEDTRLWKHNRTDWPMWRRRYEQRRSD